ncbi:uncharacterized protein LOC126578297 [Anopheles aquasalis]|uniref:uncharacterized protein LOC126578297 n=1 Tax=Anopheles aquasalis TaxID=42839 RepID=UPI00215B43B5|nr:uncharacterized protein LOC126578297 [Anopheles aquasalis]XP_050096678.1 uncharacterized protein LOC126578297 [Anopheles aquasalis]XP_050096681.1 uncharacterized protein LOC126578297 [Anopheles aquasalis]
MPKRKRAPSPKYDLLEDGFDDDLSSNDDKPGTPIQRNAANARERARMRVLSKAFFNLKRNIPWVPADTKLSKLDTLRLAKNYINYLAATLDGQSVEDFSSNLAQPPKTAWPFIFQQVQPHPEPSKSKHQQQPSFGPSTTPPAPNAANVGQISTAAADQKWSDYAAAKDGTCRDPSTGGVGVSEDIESQTVSPPHRLHHRQFSESQSVSSSGMEGVNEYEGSFGEPMVVCGVPQPQHQLQRQQVLHQQQQHHQSQHLHQHHHQQQAHEHLMVQHQEHHHHHRHHQQLHQQYAVGSSTTGGQSHNGGCHIGNGMPVSYQRQQHMTSIGGD